MKTQVKNALETERRYQCLKWPNHSHTLGEWILIMRKCLNDAETKWYAGHGDNMEVLSEIRQVTAVGVAAMEEHGVPFRNLILIELTRGKHVPKNPR